MESASTMPTGPVPSPPAVVTVVTAVTEVCGASEFAAPAEPTALVAFILSSRSSVFYLSADSSRVQFDHIIAGEGREVGIMRDDDNRPTA